jgi:hypothetical protein
VKRRVNVGEDFKLGIKASEPKGLIRHEETKSWVAKSAFYVAAASLTVSAGVGVIDGTFNELQTVWNVASPILGAIVGHYFGSQINADGAGPPG